MIINKKKFDIRQWVLVTDWNPLTVWAYEDSYVRFAAQDYDPNSTNKYSHLTNNCVVKEFIQNEYGDEAGSDEDEEPDLDNIWASEDFSNYLNGLYHSRFPDLSDIYQDHIWP